MRRTVWIYAPGVAIQSPAAVTLDTALAAYIAANPRSRELADRAARHLPGGSTRGTVFFQPFPPTMVRGSGCFIDDVDGNRRVDLLNNYTSLILGHAHPSVLDAIGRAAASGTAFAAPTEYERRLADIICDRVASVELIRFCNSGTEATMQAIRTARAFTGRDMLAVFDGGYHGTHDQVSAPGIGIPKAIADLVVKLPFNDAEQTERIIEAHRDRLAAVIVEPVMGAGGMIPADAAFLRSLREITERHGIVLIFDEVMAFRIHPNGAQGHYGVRPDLTTFGKIVGGGLPVAAFGGGSQIMSVHDPRREGISFGGTFNGHPVGLAAGIVTLELLTPEVLARLNDLGAYTRERLGAVFAQTRSGFQVTGAGSLFNVHATSVPVRDAAGARRGDAVRLRTLILSLMNAGFFLAPRGLGCLSTPMTKEHIDSLVGSVREIVTAMDPPAAG